MESWKAIGASLLLLIPLVAAINTYGYRVISYSSVLNPTNAADNDDDFAVLQYANNIVCPFGDFAKYGGAPNNFCVHASSGQLIGGWEIIEYMFNSSYVYTTEVTVQASELNLGCRFCNTGTAVKIFTSSDLNSSYSKWNYVGTCSFPDNANRASCTLSHPSSKVRYVLIGRWEGGDHRPDPAIHKVYLQT